MIRSVHAFTGVAVLVSFLASTPARAVTEGQQQAPKPVEIKMTEDVCKVFVSHAETAFKNQGDSLKKSSAAMKKDLAPFVAMTEKVLKSVSDADRTVLTQQKEQKQFSLLVAQSIGPKLKKLMACPKGNVTRGLDGVSCSVMVQERPQPIDYAFGPNFKRVSFYELRFDSMDGSLRVVLNTQGRRSEFKIDLSDANALRAFQSKIDTVTKSGFADSFETYAQKELNVPAECFGQGQKKPTEQKFIGEQVADGKFTKSLKIELRSQYFGHGGVKLDPKNYYKDYNDTYVEKTFEAPTVR